MQERARTNVSELSYEEDVDTKIVFDCTGRKRAEAGGDEDGKSKTPRSSERTSRESKENAVDAGEDSKRMRNDC
jgi:hypothetical protein